MPKKRFPWPLNAMRRWYEEDGLVLREIADLLCSQEWQPYWVANLGREYRPGQKIVNKVCKRAAFSMRSTGAPGPRNGSWNGGRQIDKSGYVLVLSPGHPNSTQSGYIREHRLVMEQKIGRLLKPTEVVHHIDGNKSNNCPENLRLYRSNREHLTGHDLGPHPPSRILPMVEAARRANKGKRKYHDWNLGLIRKWHFEDELPILAISFFLRRTERMISELLRDNGTPAVARRRGRSPVVQITPRHLDEVRSLAPKYRGETKPYGRQLQRLAPHLKVLSQRDRRRLLRMAGLQTQRLAPQMECESTRKTAS